MGSAGGFLLTTLMPSDQWQDAIASKDVSRAVIQLRSTNGVDRR